MVDDNAKTLVMKFGGTSVGSVKAMKNVLEIVQSNLGEWKRLVVVTSAMTGVTDLLLKSALDASKGETHTFHQSAFELQKRHEELIDAFVPDIARKSQVKQEVRHLITDFSNLCNAIAVLGEATPRAIDAVASLGERICARVLAASLEATCGIKSQMVESTQMIITDNHFQNAKPDMEVTKMLTRKTLEPLLAQGTIPVVTGFIGATREGITTTLGRGGSDYSAAILGVALPADEVWIWTDVDGVMTADPRLVPGAHTIPEISFREVADMAYFGAKVLHPKTIHPVIEAGIKLRVLNTFNPSHPGTTLVGDRPSQKKGEISAVTAIKGLRLISVEGSGMLGVPGVAARILKSVALTGASVPLIAESSSEQSICFAISKELADEAIQNINEEFGKELARKDIDKIWATDEVAIVSVICPDMRNTPGISGRIFSALGQAGINVIAISHGSSSVSISLMVELVDLNNTLSTLHAIIP